MLLQDSTDATEQAIDGVVMGFLHWQAVSI
jgi:hypothetical protein